MVQEGGNPAPDRGRQAGAANGAPISSLMDCAIVRERRHIRHATHGLHGQCRSTGLPRWPGKKGANTPAGGVGPAGRDPRPDDFRRITVVRAQRQGGPTDTRDTGVAGRIRNNQGIRRIIGAPAPGVIAVRPGIPTRCKNGYSRSCQLCINLARCGDRTRAQIVLQRTKADGEDRDRKFVHQHIIENLGIGRIEALRDHVHSELRSRRERPGPFHVHRRLTEKSVVGADRRIADHRHIGRRLRYAHSGPKRGEVGGIYARTLDESDGLPGSIQGRREPVGGRELLGRDPIVSIRQSTRRVVRGRGRVERTRQICPLRPDLRLQAVDGKHRTGKAPR